MDNPDAIAQRVRSAVGRLDADVSIVGMEKLSTLAHSAVSRVALSDGRTVIMKQAGSGEFAAGLRRELAINRDVLSKLPETVAPGLLSASADIEVPWLVFADIADTHQFLPSGTPPAPRHIEKFVRALGKIHAQSMQIDLAEAFANVPGGLYVTDGSERAATLLDAFLHSFDSNRFPPRTYDLVKKIRDNIPRIVGLLAGSSALIHGDAHFWNALYADDALVLDWALASVGPGEVDLCHALAMNLPRALSSEHEPLALRLYVQTCSESGVDLDERDVRDRYRIGLLQTVVVAVGMQAVAGMPDSVWTRLFTNAVHSAIDHESLACLG